MHGDGVGVLSCPLVGPCELVAHFDGVRVLGPEDALKLSDYLFVHSDGVGVLFRQAIRACEIVARFDGVGVCWSKGVKEMSGRYLV